MQTQEFENEPEVVTMDANGSPVAPVVVKIKKTCTPAQLEQLAKARAVRKQKQEERKIELIAMSKRLEEQVEKASKEEKIISDMAEEKRKALEERMTTKGLTSSQAVPIPKVSNKKILSTHITER